MIDQTITGRLADLLSFFYYFNMLFYRYSWMNPAMRNLILLCMLTATTHTFWMQKASNLYPISF